jgi:nucleoside-diphosphate-sugar epimerase
MKVVVVGATGNVGTSVVEALAADPRVHDVVGVARRPPRGDLPAKTTFVAADVRDADLVPIFDGADAVVHLAWFFQPTREPAVTWEANVIGSTRVFTAAGAAGVGALVHASSVGAYSRHPADDHEVDESWATHATNSTAAYGREKAYLERALDGFERSNPGMRVVRMRPAFTFKRAAASSQRRIFAGSIFPDLLVRPGRLPVLPLPRGLRIQAVHSADVADAYVRAVTSDATGAFNIAADDVLDAAGLAAALGARPIELPTAVVRAAAATAWHAHLLAAAPELFDMALGVPLMATRRAREELGWSPQRTAAEAVAEMAEGIADGAGAATEPLAPRSVPA